MDNSEDANPATGEVGGDELERLMGVDSLVNYTPVGPIEIERMLIEIGNRLEKAVPVLKKLWQDRYDAERALIEAKAKAMLRSKHTTVTLARAEADLATIPELRAFNDAKEILHAAEALQKALHTKAMGYMNLNKAQQSAYFAGGRG